METKTIPAPGPHPVAEVLVKTPDGSRNAAMDSLRSFVVVLVVLVHANVTYSGIGSWYLVENNSESLDPLSKVFVALFGSFTQAWFMGLLFMLSGFYAEPSLRKKGFGRFVGDRALRLVVPALLYMCVVNPLLVYFGPGVSDLARRFAFGEFLGFYFGSGRFLGGSGPLWFAIALFVFSVIHGIAARIPWSRTTAVQKRKAPGLPALLAWVLVVALAAFCIRLYWPIGTAWLNMQFCFFAAYVGLYIFGARAASGGWFEELSGEKGMRWLTAGLAIGIPAWFAVLIGGGALENDGDYIKGGFYWQAAAYALWESFVALAMSIGLVAFFSFRLHRETAFSRLLAANSFSVFVFHAPVLVGVTVLFSGIAILPPLKALLVGLVAYVITLLAARLLIRSVPGLRRLF